MATDICCLCHKRRAGRLCGRYIQLVTDDGEVISEQKVGTEFVCYRCKEARK